jgi:predicted metalloprotease
MSDVTVNNGGTLSGGYVLSKDGAWSADVAATIAPAQGFLVQIDKTGVTATITKPTGGSKSRANNDYIKFIVANSQHEDAAFALFDEGYGLNKIDHRNSDIPMLYIPKEGHNFAIATMADNTQSFNLNLKAKTTGKYTLSYKATGNYSYLHVIDRLTGEDVDMLLDGEYSFIASPSDAENRFIVRLEYMNGLDNSENSIFAYQSGSDIIVNGEGELQIFDMMGRRVSTQYVSGVETINLQSHGVYIFKLNEKTQKIVVR